MQYELKMRMRVHVDDEAALLRAMAERLDSIGEYPDATRAFLVSDTKAAIQWLADPRAMVAGLPGVRFVEATREVVPVDE